MIKTLIESPVSANEISRWIDQYYDWIKFHTRSKMNLAINTSHLVKAQYHEEEGRGGYFAPESGTSEGQFLTILGALEIYKTTKDLKWLSLAETLSESTLRILFRDMKIPSAEFDKDYIYSPHWLFNATDDEFTAEQYYLDREVEFVNGIGTLKLSYTARKIFSVRALDATLLWENPFAEIVGKKYNVTKYTTNGNTFTIYLDENYTGKLLVVYSDMGGPQIKPNEVYEAYPIWRKLADTEVACAIDSLWWSYDCWKSLYELTGREQYNTILQNLKGLIKYACSIENAGDYLTTDLSNHDPLSTAGSYVFQERVPEATISRDINDGAIVIDVPTGTGIVQLGRGDIEEALSKGRSWKLKYSNSKKSKLKLIASTSKTYNEDERWYYYFTSNNISEPIELDIKQEDFVKLDHILFDIYYNPQAENIYESPNSNVILSEESESNGRIYRKVELIRGNEEKDGGSYLGWAQYEPILEKHVEYIPPFVYKSIGLINIRIKDELDWYWEYALPETNEFTSINIPLSSFTLSSYQINSGENPTSPTGIIEEFLFDAVGEDCILELKEIGEFIKIPQDKTIYKMDIETSDSESHTLKIYYLRPIPLEGYDYAPWVAPFTLNTINNRLDGWRGTPYVGYQCPWIWQELEEPEGVDTVLDFIRKSQEEYKRVTGNSYGFFVQVFIWDRWDSREYGKPNTFTWNGPDPNTFWGGFQYRALETVARTLYNDPTNEKAKLILEDFMSSLNTLWTDGTKPIPTIFNEDGTITAEYKDPHCVALVLRSAIYCLLSGNFDSELANDLITKSILCLQDTYNDNPVTNFNEPFTRGTWSIQNNEWYMYWGAEILQSLALLLRYMKNEFYIMTEEGAIVVDTYPEWYEIEKYVKIKTPSGNMKVELVSIDDERATQLRIKTEDKIMAIKGGTKMSSYELQLLKNNTNNAAKTINIDSIQTYLQNSIDGVLTIRTIKGKSLKNISTIKQYNYKENNWVNTFTIKPSTTYTVFADVLGTGSSVITKSEKNAEGTDSSWEDLNKAQPIKNGDKILFSFTSAADSVSFTLYLQQDGTDIQLDNIMVFEGLVKSRPTSYSADYVNSIENGTLNIKIMVEGMEDKYSKLNILDYLDSYLFPMRSNGDVYDEINSYQLIKRIGDNNEVLDTPLYHDLKKPLPILECWNDSTFFITTEGIPPEICTSYPILFETLIDERIQLNNK